MKKAVIFLLIIAFAIAFVVYNITLNTNKVDTVTEEDTSISPEVEEILKDMTLEEKIGQMLMPEIKMHNGKKTTSMNTELAHMIENFKIGGVILFEKNIESIEQLATLNHDIQKLTDIPMFISIDQEGGKVSRIPGGTNMPGNMALGAVASRDDTYKTAQIMARELKALRFNLNFAPVLDVNINPQNPVINVRSFGADPKLVSSLGIEYMKGLQSENIIATAKHFPGHGDTNKDSHYDLPLLNHNRKRLDEVELKPFKEAIENGLDMIMTAHVTFPEIDNTTAISQKDGQEITIPATLSKKVLTDLLRNEMNFQGVIITDAFSMEAISEHFGEEEAVIMAINAGADIILMPIDLEKTFNSILNAVKNGEISMKQINDSVERILVLKEKYNLLPGDSFNIENNLESTLENTLKNTLDNKIVHALNIVGNASHKEFEKNISEKAVTLIANRKKTLPYKISGYEDKKIAVYIPNVVQMNLVEQEISKLDLSSSLELKLINYASKQTFDSKDKDILEWADLTILLTLDLTDENKYLAFLKELIEKNKEFNKDTVVMATGNPYDIMYFSNIDTYLAVYNGIEGPNIPAGIRTIFGESNPRGVLPVSIPNMQGPQDLFPIGFGLTYD
jgi:beta-N-acetylhexosaminidase